MGQQQLLLLVLGVVLVGLAVVVGISSFNENRSKSEIDRYTAMGVEMSGDIIAWYLKSDTHGGAGQSAASLGTLTIDQLGYTVTEATTWAGYTLSGNEANGVMRFVGASTTHPFLHIHRMPRVTGMNRVEVHVFGPRQDCIVTRTNRYNVGTSWSDGKGETEAPDNPNPSVCAW